MTSGLVIGTMVVVLILVLLFVSYYVYRLVRARNEITQSEADLYTRLEQLGARGVPAEGKSHEADDRALTPAAAAGGTEGAPGQGGGGSPSTSFPGARVVERKVGLRAVSDHPIFLRSSKRKGVSVQIEDKPAIPLTYVLDVDMHKRLQDVVVSTTLEYGEEWAVLAEEDDEGRLLLTRLS